MLAVLMAVELAMLRIMFVVVVVGTSAVLTVPSVDGVVYLYFTFLQNATVNLHLATSESLSS